MLSHDELNNLRDYIDGRTAFCDNPQVIERVNDVCKITNYVGGAINIKRDDLHKSIGSYVKSLA